LNRADDGHDKDDRDDKEAKDNNVVEAAENDMQEGEYSARHEEAIVPTQVLG
jgi:hypothetical protein